MSSNFSVGEIARKEALYESRYAAAQSHRCWLPRGQETDRSRGHYMDGVIIHGSPARVVDELKRLEEELPLDYLLLSPLSEKTFDLFSEQVLPKVLG